MSEAFEILSDALDEAIADAKEPKLERRIVEKETSETDEESTSQSKAG